MKAFFYILLILLLVSCKNSIKNISSTKITIKDNVSSAVTEAPIKATELPEIKLDSIKKVSRPFELNKIVCYWENYIIKEGEIHINLKDFKTKKILLSSAFMDTEVEAAGIETDINSDELFNELNNKFFDDLNFDGFSDFYYYSKGSSEMTSLTNIYLFNNQSKMFEYSKFLSASHIEDIDKKTRKLVTENSGMDYGITNTHYFDNFGKLKYTEILTEYWNPYDYKIYEKVINGEVVKRDSTFISKE